MRIFTSTLFGILLACMPFFAFSQEKIPALSQHVAGFENIRERTEILLKETSLPIKSSLKSAQAIPQNTSTELQAGTYIQIDYTDDINIEQSPAVEFELQSESVLLIKGFWGITNTNLTANINKTNNTISIQPQQILNHPVYGSCDIYAVDWNNGTFNPLQPIEGTIEDGMITINSWACVITTGDYKGYNLGVYKESRIKPSNATMNSIVYPGGTAQNDPIRIEQINTNTLRIYNFANVANQVDVMLKGDKKITIEPQFLFSNSSYGDFYCYSADLGTGTIYPYNFLKGTAEDTNIMWENWIISTSRGAWSGKFSSSTIQTPFQIQFPSDNTTELKGTGSESDPYLIETATDLLFLAEQTNDISGLGNGEYKSAFKEKYFKQTADIDLADYSLSPIGGSTKEMLCRFAGTYDGGGNKIKNMTILSSKGYCGLFGTVDTMGVLKNIFLEDYYMESGYGYLYTGGIAGRCFGIMENCHATGEIKTTGFCVGGVVGSISGKMSNASFSGNITGSTQTGGVIGASYCPVENAWSDAIINSSATVTTSSVGGIIGTAYNTGDSSISGCYFAGKIKTPVDGLFAGGIAGVAEYATIEKCFNIGTIITTGAQSRVGGIIGAGRGITISNCYNAGAVNSSTIATAGILGYGENGTHPETNESVLIKVDNCYASTRVRSLSSQKQWMIIANYPQDATITNCYFDKQIFDNKTEQGGLLTNEMVQASGISGFDPAIWNFTDNLYPRLKGIDENAASYLSASTIILNEENTVSQITQDFTLGGTSLGAEWKALVNGQLTNDGKGFTIEGSKATLNGTNSIDTLIVSCGNYTKEYIVTSTAEKLFEGEGTTNSPYLIKSKEDLIKLSKATSVDEQNFDNIHFRMTNDIDLEYNSDFIGISTSAKSTVKFNGTFDGGGFTINRFRIIAATLDETNKAIKAPVLSTNRGFIGRLGAIGTVKNIAMAADCEFIFWSSSGAIVGYSEGGLIENCKNYAPVIGYSMNVGGIIYYAKEGTVIRNCYNAGKITTGYSNAAGIAATNRGLLENCQNDGEVSAEELCTNYKYSQLNGAGGISCTTFGTIKNVLNTGYIHAPKYVGGILAVYNDSKEENIIAESSINLGMLKSDDETIGHLVGRLYREKIAKNIYYDKQLSLLEAVHSNANEGCYGLTTTNLTSGNQLEGLDPLIWTFEKDKYPVLTKFKNEIGSKAASNSVVFFSGEEKCDSISSDTRLGQDGNLSWTLKTNTGFVVEDNSLCLIALAESHTDTLIANYSGILKVILVKGKPVKLSAPEITDADKQAGTEVTITSVHPGASIYYTLDGTIPTRESLLYTESFLVTANCTVKAYAIKRSNYDSEITEKIVEGPNSIEDSTTTKEILSRIYISSTGVVVAEPVNGIYIEITTYSDGSKDIIKRIF